MRESPRDYLSDTPLACALWGFWCLNMAKWVRYPLPLFSAFLPIESMRMWRCDTPPQKGYLSDTCAIPYENTANGCDTPLLAILSRKGIARYGVVSRTGPLRIELEYYSVQNYCVLGFCLFEICSCPLAGWESRGSKRQQPDTTDAPIITGLSPVWITHNKKQDRALFRNNEVIV